MSNESKKRPASSNAFDCILMDIEGTTTPISFVKEILFPYVSARVEEYLTSHYDTEETQSDIADLQSLSDNDLETNEFKADNTFKPIVKPDDATADVVVYKKQYIQSIVANVLWQISRDRKSTALKKLQGHMWRVGYEKGEIISQVYDDVNVWMNKWKEQGIKLCIYSSGSVEAQVLLFKYTAYGDLTTLLSGYFDTKVGMKQESPSYAKIAKDLMEEKKIVKVQSRVLFLTDIYNEAKAARDAGLEAVILDRPGNYALPKFEEGYEFTICKTFDEVEAFIQKKNEEVSKQNQAEDEEEQKSKIQKLADTETKDTSSGAFNTF